MITFAPPRPPHVEPTADVHPTAALGGGTVVWHLAQVREHAELGDEVVVGRGAYVGTGVQVGSRSKLQNHALVYEPAVLGTGVFIGPGAVLTNDHNPRAVTPDGALKTAEDWEPVGVHVAEGASVGARAVCVAPVRVGRWALVAAGAVVVDDVPDFALVAGVPARQVGWVGRAGVRLEPAGSLDGRLDGSTARWRCPRTGEVYVETADGLSPAHG